METKLYRAKGMYVIEYHAIAMYCPMTKTSAKGGFEKTRPATNVKTIESKYMSDASKRPRSNIFCSCFNGPIKKHVLKRNGWKVFDSANLRNCNIDKNEYQSALGSISKRDNFK